MSYDPDKFEEDVRRLCEYVGDVIIKKQKDFGPYNISRSPGGATNGLVVRLFDKVSRIANLFYNKIDAKNEPLIDSFLDVAGYGVIGLMVLEGSWPTLTDEEL